MARRSDHSKDEIKEMALVAAERIISEEGFTGLSARKIAKQIGYTVGTLYLVFANQDDLIIHVNARTLDKLYAALCQASDKCRQPKTCIIAVGRAYVEFATHYPRQWTMIFEHSLPDKKMLPDWFNRKVIAMFDLVEQQLQPLMVNQPKRKLSQTARTLWCGVHGICALAVTNKLELTDAESIQQLTDSLIKYYLAGLVLDLEGEK